MNERPGAPHESAIFTTQSLTPARESAMTRYTRRSLFTRLIPAGVVAASMAQLALSGEAAAKSNPFPPGYCTALACDEFNTFAPEPGCNWRGDAGTWLVNARAAGWPTVANLRDVSTTSIAVWTNRGAGHVGRVIAVYPDGALIREMNVGKMVDARRSITTGFGKSSTARLSWARLAQRDDLVFAGYIIPRPLPPAQVSARVIKTGLSISGSAIELRWSLRSSADAILIERSALGAWVTVAHVGGDQTSWRDGAPARPLTHRYRIRTQARHGGLSEYSAIATI